LSIAIVILVLRFSERTEVLKVAVGPADGDDAKLIAAIGRHLERDRARTRFVIISANDPAESAKALESGHADLAVIRSDVAVPPNGATIIILHNDAVTLATPPASKTTKVTDLRTKQVGVFPPTAENAALLDAILGEYDIAPRQFSMSCCGRMICPQLRHRNESMRYLLLGHSAVHRSNMLHLPLRLETVLLR
jgi:TRAP-type uncharacterized transport system substrate-binding protein